MYEIPYERETMNLNRATRRALRYRPTSIPRPIRDEIERSPTPPTPHPNTPRRTPPPRS